MNIYFELVKTPTFTMEYVTKLFGNHNTARSAVARLVKDGLVRKIRNNLYTCLTGRDGTTIASKYQIASAITETACVSHHSAFEYYGLAYRFVPLKISIGIEEPKYSNGVRITDKERTIIDGIKDLDKISGLEEILSALEPRNLIVPEDMHMIQGMAGDIIA